MEFLEEQKQKLVEDVARQLEEEKDVDEDRIKVCTAEVLERTLNGEYMTIKEKRELCVNEIQILSQMFVLHIRKFFSYTKAILGSQLVTGGEETSQERILCFFLFARS